MNGVVTDPREERLAILLEELGEAIQIIGKIQRHGWLSHNPNDERPDNPHPPTNKKLLEKELGHVLAAIHLAVLARDINPAGVMAGQASKLAKVISWLHCAENIEHAQRGGGFAW